MQGNCSVVLVNLAWLGGAGQPSANMAAAQMRFPSVRMPGRRSVALHKPQHPAARQLPPAPGQKNYARGDCAGGVGEAAGDAAEPGGRGDSIGSPAAAAAGGARPMLNWSISSCSGASSFSSTRAKCCGVAWVRGAARGVKRSGGWLRGWGGQGDGGHTAAAPWPRLAAFPQPPARPHTRTKKVKCLKQVLRCASSPRLQICLKWLWYMCAYTLRREAAMQGGTADAVITHQQWP